MDLTEYNQKVIDRRIKVLKSEEEDLIIKKREIDSLLLAKRRKILYWQEMNTNQYKAF